MRVHQGNAGSDHAQDRQSNGFKVDRVAQEWWHRVFEPTAAFEPIKKDCEPKTWPKVTGHEGFHSFAMRQEPAGGVLIGN